MERVEGPLNAPEELWDTILKLDALALSIPAPNPFRKILGSGRFALIPLGKLHGTEPLWLIPGLGSLPTKSNRDMSSMDFVPTNGSGLGYGDGSPSVDADDEEKLRRFVSLMWIVTSTPEDCTKTGHALVVDLEPGRRFNPWIVLACEFPNDTGDLD